MPTLSWLATTVSVLAALAAAPLSSVSAQSTQCVEEDFWQTLDWLYRAYYPDTDNPSDLARSPLHTQYDVGEREPSTESRIALFGDFYPMQGDTPPIVAAGLREIFARADLVIGNNESRMQVQSQLDTARDQAMNFVSTTGFLASAMTQYCMAPEKTVLNVANNHAGDLVPGREDEAYAAWQATLEAANDLASLGTRVTGIGPHSASPPGNLPMTATATLPNGVQVGVVGWTQVLNIQHVQDAEGSRCIDRAWTTAEDVTGGTVDWSVFKAQSNIDLLIGSVHWQDQFRYFPDQATRLEGLGLRDAGFDLIAGHGPSVVQPAESSREGIFYSLGALNTNFPALGALKPVVVLEVTVDAQGRIVEHTLHTFAQRTVTDARLPNFVWCDGRWVSDFSWTARQAAWEVVPLSALTESEAAKVEEALSTVFY